jgi:hypothetical protein
VGAFEPVEPAKGLLLIFAMERGAAKFDDFVESVVTFVSVESLRESLFLILPKMFRFMILPVDEDVRRGGGKVVCWQEGKEITVRGMMFFYTKVGSGE